MSLLPGFGRRVAVLAVAAMMALTAGCGGDEQSSGGGGGGSSSEKPVRLTIGGWGGAINKATKAYYTDPYAAETKNTAVFDDAPAAQLARLKSQAKANKVTWDVLDSVGGDAAWPLHSAGLLAPLPADLKTRLEETLGEGKVTDFGFTHANIGHVIVCNMDEVDTCPKTMAEFFDVGAFPERRMFPGVGPLTAAAMAQSALGVSKEDIENSPPDVDAVFDKLGEIKSNVKVFFTSGDQQEQIMRSGEAAMGIMWSGRAYALKAAGMNLEINWDGGVYEPSYWAVAADAPNKEAGFKLIEWIADNVEGEAKWAEELHYSVPNPKALETLPEEIQEELVDTPANFDKVVMPNYAWYAENTAALDKRFQDFVSG